jgi:hypothetical protein
MVERDSNSFPEDNGKDAIDELERTALSHDFTPGDAEIIVDIARNASQSILNELDEADVKDAPTLINKFKEVSQWPTQGLLHIHLIEGLLLSEANENSSSQQSAEFTRLAALSAVIGNMTMAHMATKHGSLPEYLKEFLDRAELGIYELELLPYDRAIYQDIIDEMRMQ